MTMDEQTLTRLRERIALSKDFSPDERTLILDCINRAPQAWTRPTPDIPVYMPENDAGQIDALYAALSVDGTGEGLCAGPLGMFPCVPLVVAYRRHLDLIRDSAAGIAQLSKKTVRIVRFTLRQELETLEP